MISLSLIDLTWAGGLVLLLGGVTLKLRLGVSRDLVVASVRMVVQLTLIGLVLKVLFAQRDLIWVVAMAGIMVLVAGREVVLRQRRRLRGWGAWLIGTGSLAVSSFTLACFALVVMVRPDPWYHPQYAIPLLGMLLGNTMNGIALALDRLTHELWTQREAIEQRLMLGESVAEATRGILSEAVRGALIPVINAMAVAGLVSLPGMMTGQILSGVEPTMAVRYQILIWLLIAAGSGFGMLVAVHLACRKLFDERDRLRLERLEKVLR